MVWMVNAMACPLYALEVDRYPLYRRLVGPHWAGMDRRRKFLPLPRFVSCTVQSVASRYTDCAVVAHRVKKRVHTF